MIHLASTFFRSVPWLVIVALGAGCAPPLTMEDPLEGQFASQCGNGIVNRDEGETCDGNCPASCDDRGPCTQTVMTGDAAHCNVVCTNHVVNACRNGDGCCPADCSSSDDNDCTTLCDNGVVDPNETCDPSTTCPTTCDDDDPCTDDRMVGSARNCNAVCVNDPITACRDGDQCCPDGCAGSDDDCKVEYPDGPYGTTAGTTIDNFEVYECVCSGTQLQQTRTVLAEHYIGSKATMLVVSTEWCGDCKTFASIIEDEFQAPYGPQGLNIIYVLYEDDNSNSSRSALEALCCPYRDHYAMTFAVAIDPQAAATYHYGEYIPFVMLMDGQMRITHTTDEPAYSSGGLKPAIEAMLSGP